MEKITNIPTIALTPNLSLISSGESLVVISTIFPISKIEDQSSFISLGIVRLVLFMFVCLVFESNPNKDFVVCFVYLFVSIQISFNFIQLHSTSFLSFFLF